MDIDKASKIVNIYGKHLEHCSKLNFIFGSNIPESFLPFPKDVIEEASNILAEHHFNNGNKTAVSSIENAKAGLIGYINDEEAILKSAKLWNEPAWRESMLPAFKEFQKSWIKTQDIDWE